MTTPEGRLTPEVEKYFGAVEEALDYAARHSLYPEHPDFTTANYSLRRLRDEFIAVRRERDEWHSQLRGTMERLTTALRELDEARKDSARLDWVIANLDPWPLPSSAFATDPRAAIDAAMAKDGDT